MHRYVALFAGLLLSTGLCAQQQTLPLTPASKAVPGRLIVLYRNHIVPANADEIAKAITALRSTATSVATMKEPELNLAAAIATP